MSFVTISDQVQFVVQDRKMNAVYKFSLIDMETQAGDMGQAQAA
jgi:hypothetical protein